MCPLPVSAPIRVIVVPAGSRTASPRWVWQMTPRWTRARILTRLSWPETMSRSVHPNTAVVRVNAPVSRTPLMSAATSFHSGTSKFTVTSTSWGSSVAAPADSTAISSRWISLMVIPPVSSTSGLSSAPGTPPTRIAARTPRGGFAQFRVSAARSGSTPDLPTSPVSVVVEGLIRNSRSGGPLRSMMSRPSSPHSSRGMAATH